MLCLIGTVITATSGFPQIVRDPWHKWLACSIMPDFKILLIRMTSKPVVCHQYHRILLRFSKNQVNFRLRLLRKGYKFEIEEFEEADGDNHASLIRKRINFLGIALVLILVFSDDEKDLSLILGYKDIEKHAFITQPGARALWTNISNHSLSDHCQCRCSSNGCAVLTITLKDSMKIVSDAYRFLSVHTSAAKVVDLLDNIDHAWTQSSA